MTALHNLPTDHRLRNVPLESIEGIQIVCRHTKTKRDPRTWKIKGDSYNRLCETWQNNFDFIIQPKTP